MFKVIANLTIFVIATLIHFSLSLTEKSQQWVYTYYTETVPETAPDSTVSPTTVPQPTPPSSFCPQKDNCLFYQVNQNYTDYGCSVCQYSNMLVANNLGIGECKMPNNIKNCKNAVSRPDWIEGEPVCIECNQGYVLKNDSYTCSSVPENKKIKNCDSYYYNNTEYYCNVCNEGYTLTEQRKDCESGCRLSGCGNCQILNGKFYCFNCQQAYIGVLDQKTLLYNKCLSCDEYQYNLTNSNSTYRPN